MNERTFEFVANLNLLVIMFFGTIYIQIPIIKHIWNMLAKPTLQFEIQSGIILFFMLMFSFARVHLGVDGEDTRTFEKNVKHCLTLYTSLVIIWGMSGLYSLFI